MQMPTPRPTPSQADRRTPRRFGWLFLAPLLIALGAAAAPPLERLTLEPGVIRTRPDPHAEAVVYRRFLDETTRPLSTGTLVLVLGSLGATEERAEPWLYVAAPEGVFGWVSKRDLTPFDARYPERAYQAVLNHRLDAPAASPAVQADFDAWLGRVRAEIPQRFLKPRTGLDDPRRLLARYAEYAESCRRQVSAPTGARGRAGAGAGAGAGPRSEALNRPPYIVTASRVRVRPEPESRCGSVPRLGLGTLVRARARTLAIGEIDGVKAPWYQVETPDGTVGWVFGGVLHPFDPERPGPAYTEVWDRHLASAPHSLRTELEFLDLLGRLTPELPPALAADAALARLRGLGRVLALGFSCNGIPPRDALALAETPDLAARFGDARAFVEPVWTQGPPRLGAGAFWALHERYRGQPQAERLAWAASQADANDPVAARIASECTAWGEGVGDADLDFSEVTAPLADDGVPRYLALYPQGPHADAALGVIDRVLAETGRQAREAPERVCEQPVRARLTSTFGALGGVLGPLAGDQTAAIRARIEALLQTACPVSETADRAPTPTPTPAPTPTRTQVPTGAPPPAVPAGPPTGAGAGDYAPGASVRMQITEALAMAGMAKVAVAEAYVTQGRFPADNAAAGLPEPDRLIGNYLTGIRVADGAIHLSFGNHADPSLIGQVLTLRPAIVTDSPQTPISWLCGYLAPAPGMSAVGANLTSVLPSDLPPQCRDRGH